MRKLFPVLCLLVLPATGHAAFNLVENFDGLTAGSLNGQAGWTAPNLWTVGAAPSGGSGQSAVGASATGSNAAYRAFNAAILNTSTSATLFFRVRRDGAVNISAGVSDDAAPALFGGFEAQINNQGNVAGSDSLFNVRDAGLFDALGTGTFVVDTWYNVWMVVDNSTDSYQVWMDAGDFGVPVTAVNHVKDPTDADFNFTFRNGAATNPLTTVLFAMGGTTPALTGQFYVDDIHLDADGLNLDNPTRVPEPGIFPLLALGGVAAMGRRR